MNKIITGLIFACIFIIWIMYVYSISGETNKANDICLTTPTPTVEIIRLTVYANNFDTAIDIQRETYDEYWENEKKEHSKIMLNLLQNMYILGYIDGKGTKGECMANEAKQKFISHELYGEIKKAAGVK